MDYIKIGIKIMYKFTFKAGYSSSVKGARAKGGHIFRKCASVPIKYTDKDITLNANKYSDNAPQRQLTEQYIRVKKKQK